MASSRPQKERVSIISFGFEGTEIKGYSHSYGKHHRFQPEGIEHQEDAMQGGEPQQTQGENLGTQRDGAATHGNRGYKVPAACGSATTGKLSANCGKRGQPKATERVWWAARAGKYRPHPVPATGIRWGGKCISWRKNTR